MARARHDARDFAVGIAQNAAWDLIKTVLIAFVPVVAVVVGWIKDSPWILAVGGSLLIASLIVLGRRVQRGQEEDDELLIALLQAPGRFGVIVPQMYGRLERFIQIGNRQFRDESDPAMADRFQLAMERLDARSLVEFTGKNVVCLTATGAMKARAARKRRERWRPRG